MIGNTAKPRTTTPNNNDKNKTTKAIAKRPNKEDSKHQNATFEDFHVDPDGIPIGIFGVPWNKTQAKDGLRPLC